MAPEYRWARLWAVVLLWTAAPLSGQFTWSGDIAVTARALDRHITENTNFRGDDPFSSIRLRMMPRHWVSHRMALFGELLYDSSVRDGIVRVNGAYLVINELFDRPWLSLKAGLIPSPFGNYGLRSTYFGLNPLIGVPLMWHHRTPLNISDYSKPSELLDRRIEGTGYQPIAYDACWEPGLELFGELGMLEYSLAVTEGTLSNPTETSNDGRQMSVRLGLMPMTGLRFGGSVARGPYLLPEAADTNDPEVERFNATVSGLYLEYKAGYLQLHSEAVYSRWESPYMADNEQLAAWSGYFELRYDVAPALYLAGRYDLFGYSTFTDPGTNTQETWGNDLRRIETGIGYRISRELLLKAVYQRYDYATYPGDSHLVAVQLHMVF